jgi:hypothetical protein
MVSPESLKMLSLIVPAVLLIVGMVRPLYGVVAYMIVVYCKLAEFYPELAEIRIELVVAVVVLARLALSADLAKLSPEYNAVNKYVMLLVGSVFLSFLFAMDRKFAWDNAIYHFLKAILLYMMIVLSVDNEKDIKIFVWCFVSMFAYLAYEPAFRFITGSEGRQYDYGVNYIADIGILSGHVSLANNMNQMIPIAFFLVPCARSKIMKMVACAIMAIFVIALIGSGSRGGVVGFIVFCGTLVYFSKRRVRNALITGLLVFGLFLVSPSFKETGARIEGGETEGRLVGIIHGIEMIRLKGHIFGVGPGCFMLARGRYFGHTMMSHNIYGEILGDLGIPGTVVCILLIREIFRNFRRAKGSQVLSLSGGAFIPVVTLGFQMSLIVRLFVSLGSHGLYYFYWYLIAALSIALFRNREEAQAVVISER